MKYPTFADLQRTERYLHRTPAERLASSYVRDASGCWLWTGSLTSSGYGHFSIRNLYYQAHKLLYILHVGPIPDGLQIDHLCRTRRCVNPDHLEVVTQAENCQRGVTARLSPTQVQEIRSARVEGARLQALAQRYGVTHSAIWRIVHRLTWRDVA